MLIRSPRLNACSILPNLFSCRGHGLVNVGRSSRLDAEERLVERTGKRCGRVVGNWPRSADEVPYAALKERFGKAGSELGRAHVGPRRGYTRLASVGKDEGGDAIDAAQFVRAEAKSIAKEPPGAGRIISYILAVA